MQSYVTVGCPSVRPSVCPVDRQQQRRAAGLLRAREAAYQLSLVGVEFNAPLDTIYVISEAGTSNRMVGSVV